MMTRAKTFRPLASRPIAAIIAVGVIASMPLLASAQTQQPADPLLDLRPPKAKSAGKPPVATSIVVAAGLGGLVIFAGLMPAKRGHQD